MRALAETVPDRAEIVVVGGGIAGLSSAWQLTQHGVRDVVLLEAEPWLASHSSARNAAIYLPLEENMSAVWLAQRSRELLDARLGNGWLSADGVVLGAADEGALAELQLSARRFGIYHERWTASALTRRLPELADGAVQHALCLPLAGVMDIHAVLGALSRWARRGGARLLTEVRVSGFDLDDRGALRAVQTDRGTIRTSRVVLAAGAWAAQLGALAGADLTLRPLRRHLVLLHGPAMPARHTPVVWRVDQQAYYRPEGEGILSSPCDETPFEPCLPPVDEEQLLALDERLTPLAPRLAEEARVVRSWACLRTVAGDRELVVGADPEVPGLHWLAGLGGRGMSCGVAAAELLARQVVGLSHPLARALGPERLLQGASTP